MRFFLSLLLILISIKAFAHQPKLIKYSPSLEDPHEIIYPEISKAYYGKLIGKSHYYKITSNKDFLFYAGILSPKVNENYIKSQDVSLLHIDYNKYSAEKDPAHGLFSGFFGKEWSEKYMKEFLFPLSLENINSSF